MTSGGINFNDYPENQVTKFCAVYTVNANRGGATDIKWYDKTEASAEGTRMEAP